MPYPVVPEYITVHLGAPDAPAENVTVTFPRYIKGVAASEIYPTWNESAIRANVLAQISVALNRVYTEFYRSRGYDFDITNNTQYDQAFSPNKEMFENINAIVDDTFNNYIVRRGNVEPLYAQFCDGVRTQCRGLSLSEAQRQFPKVLRRGDTGIGVQTIRFYLAFLGFFLPELPPIRISDVFDDELRDAVLAFQSTYGLTVDGVVGRNTWNAIRNVYEQTLYQLPPEYQTCSVPLASS